MSMSMNHEFNCDRESKRRSVYRSLKKCVQSRVGLAFPDPIQTLATLSLGFLVTPPTPTGESSAQPSLELPWPACGSSCPPCRPTSSIMRNFRLDAAAKAATRLLSARSKHPASHSPSSRPERIKNPAGPREPPSAPHNAFYFPSSTGHARRASAPRELPRRNGAAHSPSAWLSR